MESNAGVPRDATIDATVKTETGAIMAHWDIGSFITGMVLGLIPVFFFWLGYWYRSWKDYR